MKQAVRERPNYDRAARALARARRNLVERRIHDALPAFYLAEEAGCAADACAAGRWECHMLLGDFESAWGESDAIEHLSGADPNRLWDGSEFYGKRIIVRCLHGYGDAIQFIRYVPLLLQQAASVVIETHPEMVRILRRACGVQEVIPWERTLPGPAPQWDSQIEIMELPRAFRTTAASIPSSVPYIHVSEQERVEFCRARAVHVPEQRGLKIGLIWRSSEWNPRRSMRLSDMLPLCPVPGCSFYSLQWDATEQEISHLRRQDGLENLAGSWRTIDEFAILVSSMDLIITVDTMAAHLAGRIGGSGVGAASAFRGLALDA